MIKNYKQLVPRYLMANKKTSLSMVISILFSVMLLVSVGMIIGRYNNSRIEMAKEQHGKYHAAFLGVSEGSLNKLKAFSGISKIGTTIIMGDVQLDGSTMQIKGSDAEALDMLNAKAIEGRLPERDNEIAIEQWVYNKLEYKPKIGEKFKLNYVYKNPDDEKVTKKQVEFLLSGILQDFQDSKMFESGKAYVTLETAKANTEKSHRFFEQWFSLNDNLPIESTLDKVIEYGNTISGPGDKVLGGYRPNIFLNAALEEAKLARKVTIFFNIVVAVAVAMVIYNVFNISVLQRKKHYGLLRAIGITQKQIKFMIFFEGFLFGIIIVPIGILLGIFSTELIMKLLGGAGPKGFILSEVTAFNILFPAIVSFASIAAALYSPAKLASKVSPIESMTMENRKSSKKGYNPNKSKLIDKLMGYTGMMAVNNIKRYKKRFIATVIAMSVGIALFIFSTYVINFLNPVTRIDSRTRGDFVLNLSYNMQTNDGYSEEAISKIEGIPGIKSINKFKYIHMDYVLNADFITPSAIKEIKDKKNPMGISLMWGGYHVVSQVYGCSDEFIENLRKSVPGQISNDAQVFIVQNLNNENFTTIKDGDEVELSFNYLKNGKFDLINKKIRIDKVLKDQPMKLDQVAGYIAAFVPYKFLEDNYNLSGYQEIDINVDKNADTDKIERELQDIASKQIYGQLVSYNSEIKKWKGYQLQAGAVLLSLVIMIIIVGFVNIMNTLNMNIIIRKREFGMLRALGMTKKEMRQTLLKEASLYGFFSSFIGMIVGYVFIWAVYNFMRRRAETTFVIDLKVIILTFLVTILLCICSSILPLKRATSSDIVEDIQAME